MSKKYKLKGAKGKLSRFYKFDKTPEGENFLEINDETHAMRFYENGVIECYRNGEFIYKVDPPFKFREIKQT